MTAIRYYPLSEAEPEQLLAIMNDIRTRTHLISHPEFTPQRLASWVADKQEENQQPGCRVCAVDINGELAGWCGIQRSEKDYELAIVIGQTGWGAGPRIFRDMMGWAYELGHSEVIIHLLDSRRDYRFIRRLAREVYETELLGRRFTTYRLSVGSTDQIPNSNPSSL